MSISISYSHKIDARYILDGEEEIILPESITSLVINYDYDKNNIPIIYMGVRLETSLYNKMVTNTEKGVIVLTISKSKNNTNNSVYTNIIQNRFNYMMSTNPDYNSKMEKDTDTDNRLAFNCKEGFICLIQEDSTDNNKKIMNDIIKNSNMGSIIHKFTSHMKMVMEPLHVNKKFNFLIIPPLESVSRLLRYLNKQSVFYREGYRYFVDFNKTYLLSEEGNAVDARDGSYPTVLVNITEPTSELGAQTGIVTDRKNKAYVLNVNANITSVDIKKSEEKIFNKIIGVNTFGETKELNLDIHRTEGSSDKVRLERVPYDNMEYLDYLKNRIENSIISLHVTKTEIDSSLITPNKEYIVRNYPSFSEYNGRYVLSYKKEALLNQNGVFINSLIFGLRKVKDR